MSLNKPKYTLFKNTKYALNGLKDIIINESSFRLQLVVFVMLSTFLFFSSLILQDKIILFLSLFIPMFAEIINSAIERIVDLITSEYHDMAKRAKDIGATVVFISIVITSLIWLSVLILLK